MFSSIYINVFIVVIEKKYYYIYMEGGGKGMYNILVIEYSICYC